MKYCVWVLEIGILHETQNRIACWEIWSAHNTRSEAIKARDKEDPHPGKFKPSRRWKKATMRIRKYVPEVRP